ncbi:MAG: carbon-nitrogen hydrolase family protein [Firmicutes bacterium]|nr:carbon-nitrogen hydrolase family protein [Bacillota bacterium]
MDFLRVGLCQMKVKEDKLENIKKAENMIKDLANKGAKLIVLPEMFNCPYNNSNFKEYAEKYPNGKTIKKLSDIANRENVHVVGGSIPEKDDEGNIYNTSFIFDNNGKLLDRHRKMHLFDIDVEGGVTFKESDVLSPGNKVTVVDTPFGKIGIAICYDIRFPELTRLMVKKGARVVIIPAAFNMTTGPAHWEVTFKARALDNQIYMLATAPARDVSASYHSYGNSLIVNPWGDVISRLDEKEGTIIKDLDLNKIDKIRNQLPLLKHLRKDLYKIKEIE